MVQSLNSAFHALLNDTWFKIQLKSRAATSDISTKRIVAQTVSTDLILCHIIYSSSSFVIK